jgi:hypothetical protein
MENHAIAKHGNIFFTASAKTKFDCGLTFSQREIIQLHANYICAKHRVKYIVVCDYNNHNDMIIMQKTLDNIGDLEKVGLVLRTVYIILRDNYISYIDSWAEDEEFVKYYRKMANTNYLLM